MKSFVGLLFLFISFRAFADNLLCSQPSGLDFGVSNSFKSIRSVLESVQNRDFDPCLHDVKPPTSKKELCSMSERNFQSLMCQNNNRLGIDNQSGLFKLETGLCWWISKFHRQATHLAHYCPDCKKPDFTSRDGKKKLKKILNGIVKSKGAVEIPGYKNLFEFTSDPVVKEALLKRLRHWMAGDTFLRMQWTKSLEGNSGWSNYLNVTENYNDDFFTPTLENLKSKKLSAPMTKKRKKMIDRQHQEIETVFNEVNDQNKLSYIMLQTPGLTAHSAVVFDAKKLYDDFGEEMYVFKVQDSAYQNEADYALKYLIQEKSYTTMIYKSGHWFASSYHDALQSPKHELFFVQDYNIYAQNDKQLDKLQNNLRKDCED